MHQKAGEAVDGDCGDCIQANFCFGCAVCQDARGLKAG